MKASVLGDIISYLTVLGFLGYASVRGFMQRRPFWTWHSWWRFGAVNAFGIGFIAIALAMAAAIDRGVFKTSITNPDSQSLYMLGSTALLMAGTITVSGVMGWFALGDPERPFPGAAKRDLSPIDQKRTSGVDA